MITRRSFFRSLTIGVIGVLATRKISLTAGAQELEAYCRKSIADQEEIVRVVEQHHRYNPWSPTGYCIAHVEPEPHFITANKIFS